MSAYELRISDWSSDVCSSDLVIVPFGADGDLYVTGNKPSEAYLRSITFNIVGLAGTYSAYSADRQFQELLRIAHPSAYNGLRDSLNRLRSAEHTSELQSLMRISYAVFCLKQKTRQ